MLINCLAVGIGGFIGSVLRYLATIAVPPSDFPWATMVINIVGSFALALIASLIIGGVEIDERLSLFLRVGLCGGFTTFSTFSVEAMQLFQNGNIISAILYCIFTAALCILSAFGGDWVGKMLR